MKTISWGTRVAMLYIGFVLLIVTMAYMSMHQNIDLVSDDYYEKELAFQSKINATNNAVAMSGKVRCEIKGDGFVIRFPEEFSGKAVKGELLFFRPSDASKDLRMKVLSSESNAQVVALKELSKGMYKLQINWDVDGTAYFTENIVVIP